MNWWTLKVPKDETHLTKELDEMGISSDRTFDGSRTNIPELQRRWLEGKRTIREHRLWIVALLSAVASMASAVTALIAVAD